MSQEEGQQEGIREEKKRIVRENNATAENIGNAGKSSKYWIFKTGVVTIRCVQDVNRIIFFSNSMENL